MANRHGFYDTDRPGRRDTLRPATSLETLRHTIQRKIVDRKAEQLVEATNFDTLFEAETGLNMAKRIIDLINLQIQKESTAKA